MFAVELSVPLIWMWPLPMTAELRTGKFCELFGPASGSPASLGVTPSPPRSMPSAGEMTVPLSWMELVTMVLPVPVAVTPVLTSTPAPVLKAMVLGKLSSSRLMPTMLSVAS